METGIKGSTVSPAIRRNEMMASVKGLELIAEMRGDCAVFYTITCPSRFHATLSNGRPNPKWTSQTVRESSDYLVNTFAAFRKAMHKADLRWYACALPSLTMMALSTGICFVSCAKKSVKKLQPS